VSDETFVTHHTTRGRLQKLQLMFGDELDAALRTCRDERQQAQYLDALCILWFGPIFRNKSPRSDRGHFHSLPERVWRLTCQQCDFDASRWDARFCGNRCRQSAYRRRNKSHL
jgi:hypothetical protein